MTVLKLLKKSFIPHSYSQKKYLIFRFFHNLQPFFNEIKISLFYKYIIQNINYACCNYGRKRVGTRICID